MKTLVTLLLATALAPSLGVAQDCIDYGEFLHWAGSVDTPGAPRGVAIFGNHAYVADTSSGLQVVDITNPQSPQIVGSVDTPDYARGVAISGNYAYVADGASGGLQVIDITSPQSPQIVGSVDTPGAPRGVAIFGNHAYVADDASGLQVIDITSPQSPQIVGGVDTPEYAYAVAISGNHAYVADSSGGLQVIDITNPQSPQIVGSVDTPNYASGVAISGNHAYVADGRSGLQVIDITSPQSPQIVGSVDTPEYAYRVAISGNHAYVADGVGGLQVIDITSPQSPQIVGSVDTPNYASGVAISGNHAYVADGASGGLQLIDIANPQSPQIMGSVDTPAHAQGVAISGNHAYVADARSGLQVIDITNPQSPQIVGSVDTPEYAYGVTISGNHAYVADGVGGLQVIDITSPQSPQIVGSVDTPGQANRVAISGNHAYVADSSGLQVIDITNPQSPQIVGDIATAGFAKDVAVSGSHAYVAAHDLGLLVIDITTPENLQLVGSMDTPDWAYGVTISGNHAYVAATSSGLQVIDITNPQSPQIVGSADTPDYARGVAISGNYAYVADGASGLQVIDITNPQSPQIVGSVDIPGAPRGVAISGNYAYVVDWHSGLQILPTQCNDTIALPYLDDFDDGIADGFEIVSGTWEVIDGEYHCYNDQAGAKHISTAGEYDWADYRYDVDIKTLGSPAQEVIVRYTPDGDWYVLTVVADPGNFCSLYKYVAGVELGLVTSQPFPVNYNGEWHHMTVEAYGPKIRASFDGIEMFTYTDETEPLLQGKVGVVSIAQPSPWWQEAFFDNVSVVEITQDFENVLTPTSTAAGAIACSETAAITFQYTPGLPASPLKSYSVRINCTPEISFTETDFSVNVLPEGDQAVFQVIENGPNDFTLDYTILGTSTSGIVGSAELFTLTVTGVTDGLGTVSVASADFRDLNNQPIPVNFSGAATQVVDCGPPDPVTDVVASPRHQKTTLNWTDPTSTDLAAVEIYRAFWQDDAGGSAYPLYARLGAGVVPDRPTDHQAAVDSPNWQLAGIADPGDQVFTDLIEPRGIYYYEIFAIDDVANPSIPAEGGVATTNYWLGDVAGTGDGLVSIADINTLGDSYGVSDGHAFFNPIVDVGPTDDASGTGLPLPDGYVGFDDLVIFGLNYGEVGPAKAVITSTEAVVIGWSRVSDYEWQCQLLKPRAGLKGLNVSCAAADGYAVEVLTGELLDRQRSPVFFRNAGSTGLDVGLVVLGSGEDLKSNGELFRVRTPVPLELGEIVLTVRDVANRDIAVELSETTGVELPRHFHLSQNVPNPFNPQTTIRFDLPSAEFVQLAVFDLYGRRIRTLVAETKIAGRHEVVWDGRDDSGRQVASGTYFGRVQAGQFVETKKMVLMK